MPDLIPFISRQIGNETVNTVNARDLYAYLEMTGDYNLWIRRAIKRANLLENIDFVAFLQEVVNPKGGRPAHEHHLTFDAAKQVAIMSSMTKGHEVRLWFIEKEKELHALKTDPTSFLNLYPELRAIADLAVSTAQARALADAAKIQAEEARAEAAQANANATRALETQLFFTVAEYVYIHKLAHQLPESAYKTCSDFLRVYCLDHNIPFRKQPVGGQRWPDEYAYHISVYTEVLPSWLKRRYAQATLHVLHTSTEA